MLLGNVGASSSRTFTLGHTPQYVGVRFNATGTLTNITFTGPHGIQVNLNEAAVKALGQSISMTDLSATAAVYLIPLAAGFIGGEETSLSVTTGAGASGVDIFDLSYVSNPAGLKFCAEMVDVIANGSTNIGKFSKLIFLSAGATDVINVIPNDGGVGMQVTPAEVQAMAGLSINNKQDITVFNNSDQLIKMVTYSPVAQRTTVRVYMMANGSSSSKQIEANVAKNLNESVGGDQKRLAQAANVLQSAKINLG